jgi:hypothetical protein
VRTDEVGAGAYEGLDRALPKARLTAEGEQMAAKYGPPPPAVGADISKKVGSVYVVRPHPCVFAGGFGGLEYNSAGFHAVKSKNEFIMVGEGAGNARHVYLDGRPLPAAGTHTPTATGYSVGHIEADGTLVIQTTHLTPGRATAGGVRTAETVLTQRYEPSADGTKLKIVYTYNDPKLYSAPHTYAMTFQRMAPDATAFDNFCDATDPLESQSVVPPPQN